MKVGNPKHAAALALIALAALVYLALRLIPAGRREALAGGAAGPASASHPVRGVQLPTEVTRDAFAHPALTRRLLAASPATKHESDALPAAAGIGSYRPFMEQGAPLTLEPAKAAAKPGENAGSSRKDEGRPKSHIQLRAIMRATKPLALLTIDGKTDETVGLGEYIDWTCRIAKFSQDGVLLAFPHSKQWLAVGDEVTEK